MSGLRKIHWAQKATFPECCRCQAAGCRWDLIAGKPICPDCQESLVLGRGAPLIEKTERKLCTICQRTGTIRYLTFPLNPTDPVEMDLCPQHFRALLSRTLHPQAFHHLRQQLHWVGLAVE